MGFIGKRSDKTVSLRNMGREEPSPLADHKLGEACAAAVRNASETLKEFSTNSLLSGLSQICDHIRPVLNFLKPRKTHFGARRI